MTGRRGFRLNFLMLSLLALMVTIGLAACGNGGSTNGGSSAEDAGGQLDSSRSMAGRAEPVPADSATDHEGQSTAQNRAVISTGTVDLVSKDVAGIRTDIIDLIDDSNGLLTDERTSTNDDGDVSYATLVLRVPSSEFGTVMDQLAKLGKLEDSSRKAKDVTTQVIDLDQRIRAQEVGVHRLEILVGRAGSLSDLLEVENELTNRQGELDSLRAQQKYLRSQTSLATITVRIDQVAKPRLHEDTSGFLAGLDRGWNGLVAFVAGVLTVLGTALPFAVLAVLLGGPIWLLVRRIRRSDRTQPAG